MNWRFLVKVLVGLSGGVDSAVAALLLKQDGHDVEGAIMSIWRENGKLKGGNKNACYGPDEKHDIESARSVAEKIGIPFHVFDCADEYESIVLENFRNEYNSGHTPNPCIRCNAHVKFGALPHLAMRSGVMFDKFGTGHYARVSKGARFELRKAVDEQKDQSYFLYRLTQEQLASSVFPLGEYHKNEVRELARSAGLPVSDKPDSQDFYSGDHREILGREPLRGDIVDVSGKIIGSHDGFWNFTLGQRRGLGVAAGAPFYVVKIEPAVNRITLGAEEFLTRRRIAVGDLSFVSVSGFDLPLDVKIKIRSAGNGIDGRIVSCVDGTVTAEFANGIKAPASGQSAVFYQDDLLLAGGIIMESE